MTTRSSNDASPDGPLYKAYLRVRDAVAAMPAGTGEDPGAMPTPWEEAAATARPFLDASPLLVAQLRRYCGFLTGVSPYPYRTDRSPAELQAHRDKLDVLRGLDIAGLFVPEAPELGGFGFEFDGLLVNLDTLRLYECLLAMDRGGALTVLRRGDRRPVVLEIGAGWGGLAYALKRLFPQASLVVADLPELLLVSATYLTARFPEAEVAFVTEPDRQPAGDWSRYDFVFVPAALLPSIRPPRLDLAVNSLSYQDMTAAQVRGHLAAAAALDCPQIYSFNRSGPTPDEAPDDLLAAIEDCYWSNEIRLLDGDFANLGAQPLKVKSGEQTTSSAEPEGGPASKAVFDIGDRGDRQDYRHLTGWKKYRRP